MTAMARPDVITFHEPLSEQSRLRRPRLLARNRIVRKLFPSEAMSGGGSRLAPLPQTARSSPYTQEETFRLLLAAQRHKY